MAEQVVELAAGESKVVSFEAIPDEAKTYQVVVDGLTGSFRAIVIPPALSVDSFWYVFDAAYAVRLDGIKSGYRVTHIGLEIMNSEPTSVSNVSLAFRVINGGGRTLSPALDHFLVPISQPFTLSTGITRIFYSWSPTLKNYRVEVDILVDGIVIASDFRDFTVSY